VGGETVPDEQNSVAARKASREFLTWDCFFSGCGADDGAGL
jgi:hypothetical protein